MSKVGGNRNFGFGKQLAYAGHAALLRAYIGHYATVAAHSRRWRHFSAWCRSQEICDAREISRETLAVYGEYLSELVERGAMAVSYAQNILSTANTVLEILRHDRQVRVSPAELVGHRTAVRSTPPAGLEFGLVLAATDRLGVLGHHRAAAVAQLARRFGLRIKEAALLNLCSACRQASQQGRVRVTEGTKGGAGRAQERWVPCTEDDLAFLTKAVDLQGDGRNIIPPEKRWIEFSNHLHSVAVPVFVQIGLLSFHDLRAGYACSRYSDLTGHPAPCVAGTRQVEKSVDIAARLAIAVELGHGRIEVLSAYVGGCR